MATTVLAPSSFGQAQSDLGFSYVFAATRIREEINEALDPMAIGMLRAEGDFTNSGSDTIRIPRFGGIGYAERMQAMSGETSPIAATGYTSDFDTLTVGRYGLAKEATLQGMVLNREDGVTLELMQSKVPESYVATARNLMCVAGANFSSSVGTSGAAWTYDDELELRAAYIETVGFETLAPLGIWSVRHPEQFTDLAHSLRNEPAFQGSDLLRQLLGLQRDGGAIDVLGIQSRPSHDVVTSGGDHVGFSWVAGALVMGRPSTAGLAGRVSDDGDNMIIPELGMIIKRSGSGQTAQERFDANTWIGVDTVDPTLAPQFTLVSVND